MGYNEDILVGVALAKGSQGREDALLDFQQALTARRLTAGTVCTVHPPVLREALGDFWPRHPLPVAVGAFSPGRIVGHGEGTPGDRHLGRAPRPPLIAAIDGVQGDRVEAASEQPRLTFASFGQR